jgi:Na+/alanine symporter
MTFNRDYASGLFFVSMGLLIILLSRSYNVGDFTHMGAGFFPLWSGIVISILGLMIFIRGIFKKVKVTENFLLPFKLILIICVSAIIFSFVSILVGLSSLIMLSSIVHKDFKFKNSVMLVTIFLILTSVIKLTILPGMPL